MKEISMVQWLGYTVRTSVTMEIQDMKWVLQLALLVDRMMTGVAYYNNDYSNV